MAIDVAKNTASPIFSLTWKGFCGVTHTPKLREAWNNICMYYSDETCEQIFQ